MDSAAIGQLEDPSSLDMSEIFQILQASGFEMNKFSDDENNYCIGVTHEKFHFKGTFFSKEDMQLPRVTEAREKVLTDKIIQVVRNSKKETQEIQAVESGNFPEIRVTRDLTTEKPHFSVKFSPSSSGKRSPELSGRKSMIPISTTCRSRSPTQSPKFDKIIQNDTSSTG